MTNAITNDFEIRDFLPPNDAMHEKLMHSCMGGINLGDISQGRNVYLWTAVYNDNVLSVTRSDGYLALQKTIDGLSAVAIEFDYNMNIVITWVAVDGAYLYYNSTIFNEYITLHYPKVTSSIVVIDNPTDEAIAVSDVLFAYVSDNRLTYRKQREEYSNAYFLARTNSTLIKAGWNLLNQLQFQLLTNTEQLNAFYASSETTMPLVVYGDSFSMRNQGAYFQNIRYTITTYSTTSMFDMMVYLESSYFTDPDCVYYNSAIDNDGWWGYDFYNKNDMVHHHLSPQKIDFVVTDDGYRDNIFPVMLSGAPVEYVHIFPILFRSVDYNLYGYDNAVAIDLTGAKPIELPTYKISPMSATINNGDSMIFTVNTTLVPNDTILYWNVFGAALSTDFLDGIFSGELTITDDVGTFEVFTTDNARGVTFQIIIKTDPGDYWPGCTSGIITIVDLYTNPMYSVTSISLNGANKNISVTSKDAPDGFSLFYYNDTNTISSNTSTINNISTITVPVNEVVKTIAVRTRTTKSLKGIGSLSIDEWTDRLYIYLSTTGIDDGTDLYWSINGDVHDDFYTDVTAGVCTVENNLSSVIIIAKADGILEGPEIFNVYIRKGSMNGDIIAHSNEIIINDTSTIKSALESTSAVNVPLSLSSSIFSFVSQLSTMFPVTLETNIYTLYAYTTTVPLTLIRPAAPDRTFISSNDVLMPIVLVEPPPGKISLLPIMLSRGPGTLLQPVAQVLPIDLSRGNNALIQPNIAMLPVMVWRDLPSLFIGASAVAFPMTLTKGGLEFTNTTANVFPMTLTKGGLEFTNPTANVFPMNLKTL